MSPTLFELIERGYAITKVEKEMKNLLQEYSDKIETSKPEIISTIKEFGHEVANIKIKNVVIWDNGSADIEFGPIMNPDT